MKEITKNFGRFTVEMALHTELDHVMWCYICDEDDQVTLRKVAEGGGGYITGAEIDMIEEVYSKGLIKPILNWVSEYDSSHLLK